MTDSDEAAGLPQRAAERRAALKTIIGFAAAMATPAPVWAHAVGHSVGRKRPRGNVGKPTLDLLRKPGPGRELSLLNLHTGERLSAEYWHNGRYVPDALHALSVLLRDHCNNKVHPIDPQLFDLINILHGRVHSAAPFHVVCGYRSPETNATMHEASAGVAVHSMHIQGKAIDLRLPGTRLGTIRRTALALQQGGVGYYPEDDFVHIDTGAVRRWVG